LATVSVDSLTAVLIVIIS